MFLEIIKQLRKGDGLFGITTDIITGFPGETEEDHDNTVRFIDKVKKEGFVKTFKEALDRLDSPTSLGYSSAGIVVEAGRHVHKFSPGDRVACIGAGYASHAEYVTVPENLSCRIPDGLTYEEGSSGMLGIIALHGVRCTACTFGEFIAVTGLGLLGLLTVQILRAYGCRVVGMDIDPEKVKIARTKACIIMMDCIRMTVLRLSQCSTSTPAGRVINNIGRVVAKPIKPRSRELPVM